MDCEEILAVHRTLHLIFHRNKNQHRKSKWWKWLSMLKRVTSNIARSLENPPLSPGMTSLAEVYRQYLASHIAPRCYLYVCCNVYLNNFIFPVLLVHANVVRAFSTIVADTQFSALGTVLVCALSRLTKATGIDRDMKTQSSQKRLVRASSPNAISGREDVGEVIHRTENTVFTHRTYHKSEPVDRSASTSTESTRLETTKKKRRRKNAIDDLFDGLL